MTLDEIVEQRIKKCTSLPELTLILEKLLLNNSVWVDGTLLSDRQLVENINGLRIEIFHNEHPPPHFHVKFQNVNASFTIENCELLNGDLNGRERDIIKWWHKKSKSKLIEIWNETRPSDCKVGIIKNY